MKNTKYNYVLYEIDKFGNRTFLNAFYTLNELEYYLKVYKIDFNSYIDSSSNLPIYKYRVYSNRLKQYL